MFKKKENKKVTQKKRQEYVPPILEQKAEYFAKHSSFRDRKRWYKKNRKGLCLRLRLNHMIRFLMRLKIKRKIPDTIRWVLIDILRLKPKKFWGIYQFIGMPGEGKTLSMVAHMERVRKELGPNELYIATNFYYKNQDAAIGHWLDIIKAANYASRHGKHCVVALDEIHVTFDASDWKSFPAEMLSLLSFNRKYGLQFLCSSQMYDRIPTKVRALANYTVICKNDFDLDRHFSNYYFKKANYEDKFAGKRKHSDFIRTFVASDDLYALYDTKQQVERMTADAMEEQNKRKEALDLLFGSAKDPA